MRGFSLPGTKQTNNEVSVERDLTVTTRKTEFLQDPVIPCTVIRVECIICKNVISTT